MDAQAPQAGSPLTAQLADDAMSAELTLPAGLDSDTLTEQCCAERLAKAGVAVNDDIRQQLTAAINAYFEHPDQQATVRLEGRPPVHGEDGRIEWESDCDLQALDAEAAQSHQVDHYNRRTYITVRENQRIGRIIDPTPGADGADLAGCRLRAESGRPTPIKPDDSILIDAAGGLTALRTGVLSLEADILRVSPCLRVDEYVDFHTGNINFDGDVEIHRGIRDKFVVEATGTVTVRGLIEAATLIVGGDLHALGGMAAKSKSRVLVRQNLFARYLNNVSAQIKGDAIVDREVVNCDLDVVGDLTVRGGGLMGGRTSVAGSVHVLTLGAPSGDHTEIILASMPAVDRLLEQVEEACDQLDAQLARADQQLHQLQSNNASSATQREAMTELMFKQTDLQHRKERIGSKREQLRAFLQRTCKVDLHVHRSIEAGTSITCRGITAQFDAPVKGPLWIGWEARKRSFVWRMGEDGVLQPIADLAEVRTGRRKQ